MATPTHHPYERTQTCVICTTSFTYLFPGIGRTRRLCDDCTALPPHERRRRGRKCTRCGNRNDNPWSDFCSDACKYINTCLACGRSAPTGNLYCTQKCMPESPLCKLCGKKPCVPKDGWNGYQNYCSQTCRSLAYERRTGRPSKMTLPYRHACQTVANHKTVHGITVAQLPTHGSSGRPYYLDHMQIAGDIISGAKLHRETKWLLAGHKRMLHTLQTVEWKNNPEDEHVNVGYPAHVIALFMVDWLGQNGWIALTPWLWSMVKDEYRLGIMTVGAAYAADIDINPVRVRESLDIAVDKPPPTHKRTAPPKRYWKFADQYKEIASEDEQEPFRYLNNWWGRFRDYWHDTFPASWSSTSSEVGETSRAHPSRRFSPRPKSADTLWLPNPYKG